jgi:hypothetical protein
VEKSSPPQWEKRALGRGATTKVNAISRTDYHIIEVGEVEREKNINEPTMRGNQFDQSAQERMIIKNPTARTKESRITARYRRIFFMSSFF